MNKQIKLHYDEAKDWADKITARPDLVRGRTYDEIFIERFASNLILACSEVCYELDEEDMDGSGFGLAIEEHFNNLAEDLVIPKTSHKLSNKEYHAIFSDNNKDGIPKLALSVYFWIHDFRHLRGFNKTWENEMDESAENEFYNKIYNLLLNGEIGYKQIELIKK